MLSGRFTDKSIEVDRRDILRGAAAAALSQLVAPAPFLAQAQCRTPFNPGAFVDRFPGAQNIPGIVRVEKITPPDATKVLCVFEQLHFVDNIDHKDVPIVERAQADLYSAYRNLKSCHQVDFNHLFVEGVYHENPSEILDLKRQLLTDNVQALRNRGTLSGTDDISIATMPSYLDKLDPFKQRIEGIDTLGWIGAAEFFGFQNEISLLGAENKEYYLKTFELEKTGTQRELDLYLFDKRENALVGFAASSNHNTCYTVWGCNHNFRDNIKEHNKTSDVKFALIILTPQAVVDFRKPSYLPLPLPPTARAPDHISWDFIPFDF